MKKPRPRPPENPCIDCNGTGRMVVARLNSRALKFILPDASSALAKGASRSSPTEATLNQRDGKGKSDQQ
jgi:hypothetical protein